MAFKRRVEKERKERKKEMHSIPFSANGHACKRAKNIQQNNSTCKLQKLYLIHLVIDWPRSLDSCIDYYYFPMVSKALSMTDYTTRTNHLVGKTEVKERLHFLQTKN